jgi:Putative Ig domain
MKKLVVLTALVLFGVVAAYGQCENSTLTNVTEVVPLLHVGENVHFNFEFVGGEPPYKFEVVDLEGSTGLPPGVRLNPNGGLRGKPTTAGDYLIYLQVTDSAGCTLTVAYPITVE